MFFIILTFQFKSWLTLQLKFRIKYFLSEISNKNRTSYQKKAVDLLSDEYMYLLLFLLHSPLLFSVASNLSTIRRYVYTLNEHQSIKRPIRRQNFCFIGFVLFCFVYFHHLIVRNLNLNISKSIWIYVSSVSCTFLISYEWHHYFGFQ